MDTLSGQQIGRYRLERHLAQGGMADVYLAYDQALQRRICLKLMLPKFLRNEELRARFQREAQAAARVQHRHVVEIYDVGETADGRPFLAMEYITGGSLEQAIARQNQPFPPVYVLTLLRQVAEALQTIHHAGMVHRDLKPSNILLREDGTAVVADLGIVAVTQATRLTRTGQMLGTPYYMPPEQVRGQPLDARADMYAFGVMLYEMLAGGRPVDAPDRLAVLDMHLTAAPPPLDRQRPGLAPATLALVDTCLRKEPAARFRDMGALLAQLDRALAEEKGERTAVIPPRQRRPFDYRWLIAGIGVVLLFLLGWQIVRTMLPGGESVATRVVAADAAAVVNAASTIQAILPTSTLQGALPTNTPRPTQTPTPTMEPTVTDTAVPTETAVPATPILVVPAIEPTTELCQLNTGDRWGTTLYAQYSDELGCPLNQEHRPDAAYQRYQNGLAVWRGGDVDRVYFLYGNGTYASYPANAAPQGYYDSALLKGAFGYYWNTNADVRSRLGNPLEAEAVASQFAVQDFRQGIIFYFFENGANNYVVFAATGRWTATPE